MAIPRTSRGKRGKNATLDGPLGSNQYPRWAIERYQAPSQPAQGTRDKFLPRDSATRGHELDGAIRIAMAPVTYSKRRVRKKTLRIRPSARWSRRDSRHPRRWARIAGRPGRGTASRAV